MHKTSRQLVDNFSLIAIEDLEVQNMSKKSRLNLSKHIRDVSWSKFVFMLCYKAEEAGSEVILVNPKDTTQICSRCGVYVKKDLGEKIHKCKNCGLELDRDHNAAINILNRALSTQKRDGVGTTRINACGDVLLETSRKQETI